MAKLLVNWYKPSGKWYSQTSIAVPANFPIIHVPDSLKALIEDKQDQLSQNWVDGDWYVSVTCIEQDNSDTRFFERLYKYGECKEPK